MKQRTVTSTLCYRRGRLDSHYYLSPGVAARDRIDEARQASDITVQPLGGHTGPAEVWQPSRFKRAYAAPDEPAVPYLRPYDVFEYLPTPADWLSIDRTSNLDDYRLSAGTVLQTCSGRNLGPLTVSDAYLTQFVLSHDMIRIDIEDEQLRGYLYAFLSTPTGQAVLRQRMSGSVVDHLTTGDVAELIVPMTSSNYEHVAQTAARSLELVESARLELKGLVEEYQAKFPKADRPEPKSDGWTVSAGDLADRLDAAFHDPVAKQARQSLLDAGGGSCGDVATGILPGRYKRYYVEEGFGRPILSGTQLLQYEPVNLKYISDRSFRNPEEMVLSEGMVCFGADGRWEGRLGWPAYVTSDRDGWLASNHVMRLRPKESVEPGWLWLAFATEQVQAQIVALPYGSVVDSTRPEDIVEVVLPPEDACLGRRATNAWERFVEAQVLKQQAIDSIESVLGLSATDVPAPV